MENTEKARLHEEWTQHVKAFNVTQSFQDYIKMREEEEQKYKEPTALQILRELIIWKLGRSAEEVHLLTPESIFRAYEGIVENIDIEFLKVEKEQIQKAYLQGRADGVEEREGGYPRYLDEQDYYEGVYGDIYKKVKL